MSVNEFVIDVVCDGSRHARSHEIVTFRRDADGRWWTGRLKRDKEEERMRRNLKENGVDQRKAGRAVAAARSFAPIECRPCRLKFPPEVPIRRVLDAVAAQDDRCISLNELILIASRIKGQ